MSDSPRDELLAAVDALSPEQARTVLSWLAMMRREQLAFEGEQSVGPLGDMLGMATVAREPGKSRMSLTVDPAWHNPNGVLHGGVIYTLIDYSMGGAVQPNLPKNQACTTIEVKVSYLSAVREGTLTVETETVRQGRNIAFLESKVRDDKGKLVATGSGSMYIFEVPS
ncbi:MAG: PaaI family thioesterase [Dehalococcoidia bacterium]